MWDPKDSLRIRIQTKRMWIRIQAKKDSVPSQSFCWVRIHLILYGSGSRETIRIGRIQIRIRNTGCHYKNYRMNIQAKKSFSSFFFHTYFRVHIFRALALSESHIENILFIMGTSAWVTTQMLGFQIFCFY